jgi:hypothetical protein
MDLITKPVFTNNLFVLYDMIESWIPNVGNVHTYQKQPKTRPALPQAPQVSPQTSSTVHKVNYDNNLNSNLSRTGGKKYFNVLIYL